MHLVHAHSKLFRPRNFKSFKRALNIILQTLTLGLQHPDVAAVLGD